MSLLLLQHGLSYHLLLVNNFQVSHRFLGDARMVGSSLAIWAIWTWHSNAILRHWWTNLSPWFIGVSFPGLMVTPRGWSSLLLHIPIIYIFCLILKKFGVFLLNPFFHGQPFHSLKVTNLMVAAPNGLLVPQFCELQPPFLLVKLSWVMVKTICFMLKT